MDKLPKEKSPAYEATGNQREPTGLICPTLALSSTEKERINQLVALSAGLVTVIPIDDHRRSFEDWMDEVVECAGWVLEKIEEAVHHEL